MPDIHLLLGLLAGVFSTVAFVPYISSILKGETKPNRTTWWIWTVVGFVVSASYFSLGARSTIFYSLPIGVTVTAFLSLKHGEGGASRFDLLCLAGAAAAIVLWWYSGAAFAALLMSLAVDFFAYLPTVKKAYLDPGSEDRTTWLMFWIGSTLNVGAIPQLTLEMALYPVYNLVFNSIMLGLLMREARAK